MSEWLIISTPKTSAWITKLDDLQELDGLVGKITEQGSGVWADAELVLTKSTNNLTGSSSREDENVASGVVGTIVKFNKGPW